MYCKEVRHIIFGPNFELADEVLDMNLVDITKKNGLRTAKEVNKHVAAMILKLKTELEEKRSKMKGIEKVKMQYTYHRTLKNAANVVARITFLATV